MDHKIIWCQLENGSYVLIRSRPAIVADKLAIEWTEDCSYGRKYFAFDSSINPNVIGA